MEDLSIDRVTGEIRRGCDCEAERVWLNSEGHCCEEGRFFKRKENQRDFEVNDALWEEIKQSFLQSLEASRKRWSAYEKDKEQDLQSNVQDRTVAVGSSFEKVK
jgi:hypothetical protein